MIYITLLRSCKRKHTGVYKYFIPTGFMCRRNFLKKQEVRPLLRRMEFRMRREIKVDMSAAAVTARLKRAVALETLRD